MRKLLVSLFIIMFLASCGGGNDTTITKLDCSRSNWYQNNRYEPNSIKLEIRNNNSCTRMKDVLVQLDNNGIIKSSDSNGKVEFNNLTGLHDIHVFSPIGYNWDSTYHINTDTGYTQLVNLYNDTASDSTNSTDIKSYLRFKGAIQNININSQIEFMEFSDKDIKLSYNAATNTNPVTDYDLLLGYGEAIGSTVNTELWILEKTVDPVTNVRQLVDASLIHPLAPEKTTGIQSSIDDIVNDVIFSGVVTNKNLLMQFQSLAIPTGLTVNQFDISGDIKSTVFPEQTSYLSLYSANQIDLSKPLSFSAYTAPFTFADNRLNLIVGADNQISNGASWFISASYAIGSQNIILKPKITVIPALDLNPPGRTISWTVVNFPVDIQFVNIYKLVGNQLVSWGISIYGNENQITLPEIPSVVEPILKSGVEYNVEISTWLYERQKNNRVVESYSNRGTWVR